MKAPGVALMWDSVSWGASQITTHALLISMLIMITLVMIQHTDMSGDAQIVKVFDLLPIFIEDNRMAHPSFIFDVFRWLSSIWGGEQG